jgi:hypothetical protein
MRLEQRRVVALAAALLMSSCGPPQDSQAPDTLWPGDQQIAARLYAGTPRTPPGFLDDPVPSGFAQVTTYHVKASQLAVPAATPHEVCSDDWAQAFAWSEEVAAASSPYLDFVGNESTDHYFEFDRVPRGQADRYVRMRVYRCSYVDRTGVDTTAAAGFAGVMNVRPLDVAALGELNEYLWRFTVYNNADHAVIASETRPAAGLAHALTIASLEHAAAGAPCDRITLRDSILAADSATGSLQRTVAFVREFRARREGGLVVIC